MSDTDKFMQEELLPFYKRVMAAFEQNHHALYATFSSFMSGRNRSGMRITENGNVLGDYTVVLDDLKVSHIDNGVLTPEWHTPFGVVKAYVIMEKSTVEKLIQDEANFISHPFATKLKYIPEMTVKFLK